MKNKLPIIFFIAFASIFTACKKQLNVQPTDTFNEDNAFENLQHVQFGVNGAYSRYSAYANDMYVNALLSDEVKLGVGNGGTAVTPFQWRFSSDASSGAEVTAGYYAYYALLDQVNRVLTQIPNIETRGEETVRKEQLIGQLLALRAISHLSLLQMYADRYNPSAQGVPLAVVSCVLCQPARNTMGEVMAQIDKDLAEARQRLPAVNAGSFRDTVMNTINVAAYQARVALYKKDYPAAINHATEVISSGIKPLATGLNYAGIWEDASTAEVLFRRLYVTGTAIGSLFTLASGSIILAPSDKLVATFSNDDIRKNTFIGVTPENNTYVKKFFKSNKGGRVVDIKAIRTSEMYLIRAEAYAKTGNVTAGATDLNALRAARIANYTPQPFGNADALANAVLEERFKELCFEGFRWYDLKRNFLPVQRAASDANPEWQTLPANDKRWLLPIPLQEILANPNTTQNPGY